MQPLIKTYAAMHTAHVVQNNSCGSRALEKLFV